MRRAGPARQGEQIGAQLRRRGLVSRHAQPAAAPDLADALLALERDRERARRERQQERWSGASSDAASLSVDDLWSAGLEMVWDYLRR